MLSTDQLSDAFGSTLAWGIVIGLLVVAYAWPAREYLRQRSELAQLRADAAATQARVSARSATLSA